MREQKAGERQGDRHRGGEDGQALRSRRWNGPVQGRALLALLGVAGDEVNPNSIPMPKTIAGRKTVMRLNPPQVSSARAVMTTSLTTRGIAEMIV